MRIVIDLPEDIAKRLEAAWPDVSGGALEAIALEGYREGALSRDHACCLPFWPPSLIRGRVFA